MRFSLMQNITKGTCDRCLNDRLIVVNDSAIESGEGALCFRCFLAEVRYFAKATVAVLVVVSLFLASTVVAATDVINDANLKNNIFAYYELEESSGTRVDSFGSVDLTEFNSVPQATGIQGSAADLELSNSEYLANTSPSWTVTDDIAVSFWIKLEQLPSTAGNMTPISTIDQSGASADGFSIRFESTNKIFIAAKNAGANDKYRTDSAVFVSGDVGNWVHLVVNLDVSGNIVTIYKNNSSQATSLVTNGVTNMGNHDSIVIGRNGENDSEYFDGVVDEVYFRSTTFSASEISDLYSSGSAIPYDAGGGGGGSTGEEYILLFSTTLPREFSFT